VRRSWPALAAAVLLVALPAGWYFGSPWWTLWRVREAARAGDWTRLDSHVDRRAIAAQWTLEGRAWWASVLDTLPPDSRRNRDFIALAKRRLAERPLSDSDVKEEIRPWLAEIPIRLAGIGGGGSRYRPYIVHRGLDRFEVRDEGADLELGPALTFRRHGLGWKLVAVRFGQQ
jgi:hypothetical protein